MSSADYFLTAEELRLKKRRRRRLVFAIVSVLVLLVVGWFGARPASHAIKAWQARRHATKAFEFIAAEDWATAQKEAIAAYQLDGNEPEALRAVARFLSAMRQPQAFEFWKNLAAHEPLTRDDLRDEAAVAIALGNTAIAETAVKSLSGANDGGPASADWLLAAQFAAQKSDSNRAIADTDKVLNDSRASERQIFQALLLQIALTKSSDDPAMAGKQKADWARLTKFAQGKDAVGLDALMMLAQQALVQKSENLKTETLKEDGEQRPEVSRQRSENAAAPLTTNSEPIIAIAHALDTHPLSKTPQKLLAIDLRIHASPNEKAKLVQEAITRWKNADNDSLGDLAKWLNNEGEFARELETIPLARALQTRELFLQRTDALGALGRWEDIRRLLESEQFPLDPVIEHMYLARCYAQLGEKTATENNWQRALEFANGDTQKLMTLADYAEKNGAREIAARAYDEASAVTPRLRAAWQGKLRLAQAARDTKRIHAVLAAMLKLWPNDTAIENDEAYTRLLLAGAGNSENRNAETLKSERLKSEDGGQTSSGGTSSAWSDAAPNDELIRIEHLAEELVRREPASLPHRTLLALDLLKQHRPIAALDVYNGINITPNALTPSALAVHAAVLSANGKTDDAQKEIQQAPPDKLLPEEQQGTANLR
ncbi:MAG TPA: hypothetical protein VGG02_05910 [Chthoniobacterales bacterium]|jgi:hypothetical protein